MEEENILITIAGNIGTNYIPVGKLLSRRLAVSIGIHFKPFDQLHCSKECFVVDYYAQLMVIVELPAHAHSDGLSCSRSQSVVDSHICVEVIVHKMAKIVVQRNDSNACAKHGSIGIYCGMCILVGQHQTATSQWRRAICRSILNKGIIYTKLGATKVKHATFP